MEAKAPMDDKKKPIVVFALQTKHVQPRNLVEEIYQPVTLMPNEQ